MNAEREADRRELVDRIEHSRKNLDHVRESRRLLLKRAAGSEWYRNGSDERTPLNQMAQAEQALVQHLLGGEPEALVVAGDSSLEATAYEQSLALCKVSQRIGLRRKLRRIVRDAVYGMGICRIGMVRDRSIPIYEIAPDLDEEGEVGVGRLTLDVISLESWVHDCEAETLENPEYCGHAFWVNAEDIKHYLPDVSEKDLIVEQKRWINEQGDEQAGAISRGTDSGDAPQRKRYWLWNIWLPWEKQLITMPVMGTGEIARVQKWNSRPGGPYMYLYYREVPDQAIPMSVLADLALVHDSVNSTFRKLIDQTAEQKTVVGYKPGHEDDAERIRKAVSMAIVKMRDPNAVKEFRFNGPDQALLGMLLQSRELASIIGGNTDALAGLSNQAPTLGQEEIVQQQASIRVQSMEIDTADFLRETFEALRWYLYHEQEEPIPITKEIPSVGLRVPSQWSAAKASGPFDAFMLQLVPHTRGYQSPSQRLKTLLDLWQGIILPSLQMGLMREAPDMKRLLDIIAQYAPLPEIKQLLRTTTPEERQMAGGGEGPGKAPVTTRNYVRRGQPGPSQRGMAMQAMQMMNAGQENGAA